jgi:tRNA threonylcarbamoyladenosine modification (KEOPS) complex  Pcc1 subunit
MFSSEINITGSKIVLEAYFNALEPEKEFKTERASYTLDLKEKLTIKIKASDATAFRAINNSITNIISIVNKTQTKIQKDF